MSALIDAIDILDRILTSSEKISEAKPALGTVRDQAEALENHVTELQAKYNALQITHDKEVAELKQQIAKLQEVKPSALFDVCKFCLQPTGQLLREDPDKTFGNMGANVRFYKCTNPACGKEYKRAD